MPLLSTKAGQGHGEAGAVGGDAGGAFGNLHAVLGSCLGGLCCAREDESGKGCEEIENRVVVSV
eukprot:3933133-Rhodomonas_salina.1